MKKTLLSASAFALVAVSSMALVPTKAEAIPAFARQTGAACLSCHFQTFPALKPFGRAFKMGAFTDVGDEALIEDEHLSIPAVLNATFVVRAQYNKNSATGTAGSSTYQIPADTNLLIAGRVGSNTGTFVEFGGGSAGAGGTGAGNWQLMNSMDMGGFKVGLGVYNTGFGGDAGMTVSNVYGQHSGKLGGGDVSAIDAAGFSAQTAGIDVWAGNDMGYLYAALIAPDAAVANGTNVGFKFGKLLRAVATIDLGGFDTLVGFGTVTGTAGKNNAGAGGAAAAAIPMDLQFIDAQMQGEIGDMQLGVYADWSHAKGKTSAAGTANFYGGGVATGQKFDAYSLRVELKPIDRFLVGVGYGYNKTTPVTPATTANTVNKTTHLAATYEVYQNMEINLVYNSVKANAGTVAAPTSTTTKTTLIEVEALI